MLLNFTKRRIKVNNPKYTCKLITLSQISNTKGGVIKKINAPKIFWKSFSKRNESLNRIVENITIKTKKDIYTGQYGANLRVKKFAAIKDDKLEIKFI